MEIEPNALHAEPLGVHPNPRKLSIEETILHQIDRIGYLRSIGGDWQEPVFHLRDLIVGLEDDEFWTGAPTNHPNAEKRLGWNEVPIRVDVKTIQVDGEEQLIETPNPTAQELSQLLRIIMALLARRGLTWRQRFTDQIPDETI